MSFTQHFVNCEHGFLFHSFAISVAFNNEPCRDKPIQLQELCYYDFEITMKWD